MGRRGDIYISEGLSGADTGTVCEVDGLGQLFIHELPDQGSAGRQPNNKYPCPKAAARS